MFQTVKLHQKLGKPIPEVKMPDEPPKKANVVKTSAPKMNFVAGSKLSSTGAEESAENNTDEQEIAPEVEAVGNIFSSGHFSFLCIYTHCRCANKW